MVSVVIVNYNTFEMTCKCVDSLYKNVEGVDFEVVLVDNGSSECDPEVFLKVFPNIILVKSEINLGFAKGNNLGIQRSKGDYILLLNSDTYFEENSLPKALSILQTNLDIGVISVQLKGVDHKIQGCAQRFPSIKLTLIELFRIQKLFSAKIKSGMFLGAFFDQNENKYVDWVWGTFFMFKRSLLEGFPDQKLHETFFMYCEDIEWCWWVKNKIDKKIFYSAETYVIHVGRGSAEGRNTNHDLLERNLARFIVMYRGRLYYWLFSMLQKLLRISQRQ